MIMKNEYEDNSSRNIYIWTINNVKEMSKIRINYFWSSSTSFQKEYKERLPYLPPPEFEFEKPHDLYELMIEDYSNSRFKLSLYGRYLMEHLLENEKFESIETLLKNIINLTIKNSDRSFISNLSLMKIVTYNLRKLSYYPEIINWFLSRITFFVPDDTLSEIISTNSTSNHLQKFGEYPNIFDTSLIYLKIESFLNLMFIIFKHSKFYLRIIIPMPKIFTQHKRKKTTIKLVFPLMGLTDYSLGSYFMKNLDFEYSIIEKKFISFIDTIFDAYSSFGFSLETNLYELWIGEALLTYKWNTYGRAIHIINLFIHLFCLTCFVLTVISYDQISSFIRLFLLSIVIIITLIYYILDMIYWIYEARMKKNGYSTLSCAYITFAILLLELKILFNLHIFEFFGIEFAIIFGVFNEVLPFLVTLVLFIFIFTSSLHILLKLNSDSNENWNLVDFIIVPYTTLTGPSDIISTHEYKRELSGLLLMFLLIAILFFVAIYMMNLFNVVISNKISNLNNKNSFLYYKAKTLSRIELCYLLSNQRKKKDWFPEIIFFEAHLDELRRVARQILNNTWPSLYKPYISSVLLEAIQMKSSPGHDNQDENHQDK
ncbi:transient receptor potential cation channel subfamily a member 1-like [Gigaspora margarita]|uniref:Transient receptor potential cation channel subfamily a member 1-like n=1 Tax=Gigaspora margarita TaxID=4874 RepID=A0A8H4B4J7_GIGMA|nr:transient receptor potential cation channel subfamily a member 1-like [Gigaspora margarita]